MLIWMRERRSTFMLSLTWLETFSKLAESDAIIGFGIGWCVAYIWDLGVCGLYRFLWLNRVLSSRKNTFIFS